MENNRRLDERLSVSLGIVLSFSSGMREARISDLSISGCFIDSIASVASGELLSFNLTLLTGQTVKLYGEVMYIYPGIGFGLRFLHLTELQQNLLEQIILANGGKALRHHDPVIEEEVGIGKEISRHGESTINIEMTSFNELKKSIQKALERHE